MARSVADLPDGQVRAALSALSTTGAGPAACLRELSTDPGLDALGWLAAGWELSRATGVPLASSISAIADSCRSELAHRREVAARVAGGRATARLLASLPVAGLLLGQSLGGDPWSVLVGSPAGWACLAGGVALELTGLAWTRRLVAEAVAVA
jgi:tight adherence protein B